MTRYKVSWKVLAVDIKVEDPLARVALNYKVNERIFYAQWNAQELQSKLLEAADILGIELISEPTCEELP
jgi:hypothetical protein